MMYAPVCGIVLSSDRVMPIVRNDREACVV
jgi:hypothetical protein